MNCLRLAISFLTVSFRRDRALKTALAVLVALSVQLSVQASFASPWAEVGDAQLRSDIQLLAANGLIEDITTHWPIPWAAITTRLQAPGFADGQPDYIRAAAHRVLMRALKQARMGDMRYQVSMALTNNPNVVRGFDGMGREDLQGQVSGEVMTNTGAFRLSLGTQLNRKTNRLEEVPDGSYVAKQFDDVLLYAGYMTHWWGPGWISALSLSNNARPFPHVGIQRADISASSSPWFSWLGPWQAEFFVGWLDDKRIANNTLYDGLRLTFNPLPGLQIGLARTDQMCGSGHSCNPIRTFFDLRNDASKVNDSNSEGLIDVHFTNVAYDVPYEIYFQAMNEDTNPIVHSATSHLFGASIWVPVDGNAARLTLEYADSIATTDIFSFGDVKLFYGAAYNNATYPDGMRYRDRTLGFSLDSGSRLFSAQANWKDVDGWTYNLTYHNARISIIEAFAANIVTTLPVTINLAEARVSIPTSWAMLDVAARVQDDRPRPDRGFDAAIEVFARFNL